MSRLTLRLNANAIEDNEVGISAPLRIHVHERVEQFNYVQSYKEDEVPLVYLENEEITPLKNIDIVSRYYVVPSLAKYKSKDRFGASDKITGVSYTSKGRRIIATNVTGVNQKGKLVPLFYKHLVPSGTTRVEIRKVSNEQENLANSEFVFNQSDSAVYNNFVNRADTGTTRHTVYFVDSYSAAGKFTQILNNVSAVDEATWEDIDPETGAFLAGRTVYTVERNSDGYTFYFSVGDTYWIRPSTEDVIAPIAPLSVGHSSPWLLSFSNGMVVETDNGTLKSYKLPEVERQSFYPHAPYMHGVQVKGVLLSDSLVAFEKMNLATKIEEGRHLTIRLFDFEGNLKRILTTRSSLNGTRFSEGVRYEYGPIASWSNADGIVHFAEKIPSSYRIEADLYYVADSYTYTGYDFNPYTNKEFLNNRVIFYVVPNVTDEEVALHHLVVDSNETIIFCSQNESISYAGLGLRDSDGDYNPNTVCGTSYSIGEESFIKLYSFGQGNDYGYIVICEVSFKDSQQVRDVVGVEIRQEGNVVLNKEQVFLKNRKLIESAKSWDERGRKIVNGGALVIEYPITLLKDYGGQYTELEVQELLSKGLHVSVIPVFVPTYPKAKVEIFTHVEGEVSVDCSWEGTGLLYEFYKMEDGETWTLVDSLTTEDRGFVEFADEGLTSGSIIRYKVVISKDGITFPESFLATIEVK